MAAVAAVVVVEASVRMDSSASGCPQIVVEEPYRWIVVRKGWSDLLTFVVRTGVADIEPESSVADSALLMKKSRLNQEPDLWLQVWAQPEQLL